MLDSGRFSRLNAFVDSIRLKKISTPQEIGKLDSLVEIGKRISMDFKLSEKDVKMRLKPYFPDLDSIQLNKWEADRKLEMRMIDGEKRYFNQAVRNLFRLDDAAKSVKDQLDGLQVDSLDLFCMDHNRKVIEQTKSGGKPVLPVKMKLNYTITLEPNAVPSGKVIRCWMPFPREGHSRQQNISLLHSDPEQAAIAPATDLQRTVYLEKLAEKDKPTLFNVELEVESSAQYFDLRPEQIKPYDTQSELYKNYTAERAPQIVFTDEIRNLAAQITEGETNPLLQIRKIYSWINRTVRWASALEYGTIPNIPEYVLKNHHGDCGMQTLLLMTMVRSLGIPAKWQSGWMLHPGEVNLHDWCEVYFDGIGWVPVDQSFGLQNSADEKVKNFYSSGIDSYRLIVNDDYSRKLTPAKKYMRSEPYDFQRGELEWEGGNLYFNQWDWHMDVSYLK
jgi:transglutaminase-like putative cysteine protease